MTIGMLLNAPYPSDIRVKKETDALLAAGFRVHLLCLRRSGEKKVEQINGLSIERVDAGKSNIQFVFWDIIMATTFVHFVFKKAIPDWITKNAIRVIHVHDLPLVGTALVIRKKFRIPVVADFHENYPDALRTWFAWKKNLLAKLKNRVFMNHDRWAKHEKRATLESNHIIAVVDEMKQRLIDDYGIPHEKVTVVSNTEDKSFLNQPQDPFIYKEFNGKFTITYSGNIGPHRGVDTVIEAMSHLKAYDDIVFVLVGSGSRAVMKVLKGLILKHGVEQKVFFLGYQPFENFFSFMRFTSVNIIPHKSSRHTDNTIPHKLFQAMMTGKPVMVSSSASLKRIVNSVGSGVVFEAGNAADLADQILKLYKNKKLQKLLGRNGAEATIRGSWNWEHDQRALIDLYKKMLL